MPPKNMNRSVAPATSQLTAADTCTQTESINLMKNLLTCGLSCITYLRNLFDEGNYDDCPQNGLMLKSLKRNFSKEANNLIDWLETGCFDALEKQYLRKVILGIYFDAKNPEIFEELYEFNVNYPQRGVDSNNPLLSINQGNTEILNIHTKREIKKATQQMLRTLLTLTQTLKPLPDERIITMRLYYYDDVTPPDYQPPMFKEAVDLRLGFRKEDPVKINIGKVETPYHVLNMKIQANVDSFEDDDPEEVKDPANEPRKGSNQPAAATSEKELVSTKTPVATHIKEDKKPNNEPTTADEKPAEKEKEVKQKGAGNMAEKKIKAIENSKEKANEDKKSNDNFSQKRDADAMETDTTESQDQTEIGVSLRSKSTRGKSEKDKSEPALASETQVNQPKRSRSKSKIPKIDENEYSPGDPKAQKEEEAEAEATKVKCVCGDLDEDLGMMQCEKCEFWQHVACMGYENGDNKNLPEYHLCYFCSHENPSQQEIEKNAELALWRRLLTITREEGPLNFNQVAQRLSITVFKAKSLSERLVSEGFLKKTPYSTSKIKRRRKKKEKKRGARAFDHHKISFFSFFQNRCETI